MDTAVIGFLGVIAGALTTGGVQTYTEWLARGNDSLAAARRVYGSLAEAQNALGAYEAAGRFPMQESFARQLAVWEAQKERLARVLDVLDFQLLQAAFSNLRYIEDVVQDAKLQDLSDGGMAKILGDPNYAGRLESLSVADQIALRAGQTQRDRRRLGEHLRRLGVERDDGTTQPPSEA